MAEEYEILKKSHDTLLNNIENLEKKFKETEESYEVSKVLLLNKAKELKETNARLIEDCVRVRSETEKLKEMKKTIESEKDELMSKNRELLLAKKKWEEEMVKVENKYVELAEKFDGVETDCAYFESLYDAAMVASGTQIGVNRIANNTATDGMIMISDDEYDKPPTPRESKISSDMSIDGDQEEESRNRSNSSNQNPALGGIFTFGSVNTEPLCVSSSSSSSSSDGFKVEVKLPSNWPEWAIPKGSSNGSNKSENISDAENKRARRRS